MIPITMARRLLPALFLLWNVWPTAGPLFAQTSPRDSLLAIWADVQLPDTTRLKAADALVNDIYFTARPDSALHYAQLQYALAQGKGLDRQVSDALNNIGTSYFNLGKQDEAFSYYQKGLEHAQKVGSLEYRAPFLNNLGRIYKSRGDFDAAIAHYEQANGLYQTLADAQREDGDKRDKFRKGAANTFNNIGSIHHDRGDRNKTIEFYSKALELRREMGDKKGVSSSLNNIGIVYFEEGNHAMAIDYWTQSLRIKDELGEKKGAAATLHNIGNIYNTAGEYDKALDFYERSLRIREELQDKDGIAFSLSIMGSVYGHRKEFDKALELLNRSLDIRVEMGAQHEAATVMNSLGITYISMGDLDRATAYFNRALDIVEKAGDRKKQAISLNGLGTVHLKEGDPQKAIIYSERALALAQEARTMAEVRDAAGTLFEAYNATGNFRKALEMHTLHIAMRDSILSDENHREVMRQQFQYDYDRKEAVAAVEQERKDVLAASELRRQKLMRNGFIGGFAVMLLFAGVFFFQRNRISTERDRSEGLLLNILPYDTAQELKAKGSADARLMDEVTVLFTDFKGFTQMSELVTPKELVKDLHECFSAFDLICEKHGIEKIKTIGDAYMAAGGLPTPNSTHATDVVKAALEMAQVVEEGRARKIAAGLPYFEIRVGIHTGPVVAGIVGIKKFQYDIWGDTVNTASRMESSGEVGRVNISQATYELVKDQFTCEFRGEVEAKGKGKMGMWFVS